MLTLTGRTCNQSRIQTYCLDLTNHRNACFTKARPPSHYSQVLLGTTFTFSFRSSLLFVFILDFFFVFVYVTENYTALGLRLTAKRRGFELYECLLVYLFDSITDDMKLLLLLTLCHCVVMSPSELETTVAELYTVHCTLYV